MIRVWRRLRLALFACILVLWSGLSACTPRYEGDYRGRVIDADTGNAIEGVVVFIAWRRAYATPPQGIHRFYDARETTTDKNGEFVVPGHGLISGEPGLAYIEEGDFVVFKAGYEHIGPGSWESLKTRYLKEKVRWDDDKVVIVLKKMPMEERRKRRFLGYLPSPGAYVPKEKLDLLRREIEKERREIGR